MVQRSRRESAVGKPAQLKVLGRSLFSGFILNTMAHAIRVDSPFATVHDTADTLGVSKSRTNRLIERAKRIASTVLHRRSGGELVTETHRKQRGRAVTMSGRPNGGAKNYKSSRKKAKAKR